GLLAPDDLAGGGAAGAPAVGELADDQQPPAVLVVVLGAAEPRQRRGPVQDLADEGALQQQPQLDGAGRVAQRVGDQLGREQLGGVLQLLQAPLLRAGADGPAGAADGGRVGGQRPGGVLVLGEAAQPGDQDGDVVAVLVGVHAGEGRLGEVLHRAVDGVGAEDLLEAGEAVVDVAAAVLHEAVGVDDEEAAVLDGELAALDGGAAGDAERRGGRDLEELVVARRAGQQRRQVPRGRDLDGAGRRVVHRVHARREVRLLLAQLDHQLVHDVQRVGGRQLQVRQRVQRGAQPPHRDRGADAVPGDVADDEGDAGARQRYGLVPVAADLDELAARQVAVPHLERRQPVRQQAALEGERGGALAAEPPRVVDDDRGAGGELHPDLDVVGVELAEPGHAGAGDEAEQGVAGDHRQQHHRHVRQQLAGRAAPPPPGDVGRGARVDVRQVDGPGRLHDLPVRGALREHEDLPDREGGRPRRVAVVGGDGDAAQHRRAGLAVHLVGG